MLIPVRRSVTALAPAATTVARAYSAAQAARRTAGPWLGVGR